MFPKPHFLHCLGTALLLHLLRHYPTLLHLFMHLRLAAILINQPAIILQTNYTRSSVICVKVLKLINTCLTCMTMHQ